MLLYGRRELPHTRGFYERTVNTGYHQETPRAGTAVGQSRREKQRPTYAGLRQKLPQLWAGGPRHLSELGDPALTGASCGERCLQSGSTATANVLCELR